ncbi:cellulase family glycosylhydrolase [Acetivibrio cellulolyticus]|uniref:cellulase family glycosylhydrolase n=1 Tax=Acetivibrio cellulolyticus TaxID=35830 RepID=UPI0001E2CCBF|nr:cellulase family glycosylhydrolase [Acetivibrio cellulolyticus]
MKKHQKFIKIVTFLSLITLLGTSLFVPSVFGAPYSYDLTATDTVLDMGIGWNLGNTLEACGSWISGTSVSNYETAWGNPVTTKAMIDGVKAAGFKSIRIPVAWSNLMASDYTINADLLKRVKEVVDYCSSNDMYAIVNIHWDGGWFANFATNYDESMKKYTSVWTQISSYFKDYPKNLILESLNEEGCWDTIWNRWSGSTGEDKTRAYNILNSINQKFVDIVRASGGNNASRCLLIAGYSTDIDLTCDSCFKMPTDTIKDKLIISVHYYTPSTFTILTEDASWGKCATTWGTDAEINQVKTDFNKMKTKFADKGFPVIIGEYGTVTTNKELASVRRYITTVCKTAYDLGFCPMLWDSSEHYSRTEAKIKDTELAAFFYKYKDASRITIPTATPTMTTTPTVTPNVTPTSIIVYGDTNGDGSFNALDFAAVRLYLLGINNGPTYSEWKKASDVNGDGNVNSIDFALMKSKLLGLINKFPVEQ